MSPHLALILALSLPLPLLAAPDPEGWTLAWSDEFDQPDGSAPDPAKWKIEVNGEGGGNAELQYYSDRRENLEIRGGELVITARREKFTGADGVTREFTSGRLNTEGHFAQTYGRFEARLRIPAGQGIWPAFWMLAGKHREAGWPDCGEIDIMENVGKEPGIVHGTVHGPGYSAAEGPSRALEHPTGGKFADDHHVYAAEWGPGSIRFSVDGKPYGSLTPADIPPGKTWVFDGHPFFLILNVAVGGHWPGPPDDTTSFPQTMRVDWVRVHRKK